MHKNLSFAKTYIYMYVYIICKYMKIYPQMYWARSVWIRHA